MTYRISQVMINVDGVLMTNASGDWKPYVDIPVSSIQLQNLYLFLYKEGVVKRKAFYNYVDNVIKELLYNEH